MTEALNPIAASNCELKKAQKNSKIVCRDSQGALTKEGHIGASCVRGEIPKKITIADKTHLLADRTRIVEVGLIADNRHNALKIPTQEELTCFVTAEDNQGTRSDCWFRPLRPFKKLKKPHYLTAIIPACKTSKISLLGEKVLYVRLFLILSALTL